MASAGPSSRDGAGSEPESSLGSEGSLLGSPTRDRALTPPASAAATIEPADVPMKCSLSRASNPPPSSMPVSTAVIQASPRMPPPPSTSRDGGWVSGCIRGTLERAAQEAAPKDRERRELPAAARRGRRRQVQLTPSASWLRIHSRSGASATRAYTPGLPGRAQPSPKLVAPTTRPPENSGPPESPWHVSIPPSG